MHGVPAVHEELGELGQPVLREAVRDLAVQRLCLLGQLVVMVLLVSEGAEKVPDRLGVVGAVLAEVGLDLKHNKDL